MGANYDCLAPGSTCPLGDVPQSDVAGTCPEGGVCCMPPPPSPPFVPDTPTTPPATAPPVPTPAPPPPVGDFFFLRMERGKKMRTFDSTTRCSASFLNLPIDNNQQQKKKKKKGSRPPSPPAAPSLSVPLRPPPHRHPAALHRGPHRQDVRPLRLGGPGPLPDGKVVDLGHPHLVPLDAGRLVDAGLLARLRRSGAVLAGVSVAERGVHDQRHRRRRQREEEDEFFFFGGGGGGDYSLRLVLSHSPKHRDPPTKFKKKNSQGDFIVLGRTGSSAAASGWVIRVNKPTAPGFPCTYTPLLTGIVPWAGERSFCPFFSCCFPPFFLLCVLERERELAFSLFLLRLSLSHPLAQTHHQKNKPT